MNEKRRKRRRLLEVVQLPPLEEEEIRKKKLPGVRTGEKVEEGGRGEGVEEVE